MRTNRERRSEMYVDKDGLGLISMMEMSPSEIYVLTEALVRYAANPDISEDKREKAKQIAIRIDNQQRYKN